MNHRTDVASLQPFAGHGRFQDYSCVFFHDLMLRREHGMAKE